MLLELNVSDSLHLKHCDHEKKACFRMKIVFNFGLLYGGEDTGNYFIIFLTLTGVSKYQPIQRREVHAFLR